MAIIIMKKRKKKASTQHCFIPESIVAIGDQLFSRCASISFASVSLFIFWFGVLCSSVCVSFVFWLAGWLAVRMPLYAYVSAQMNFGALKDASWLSLFRLFFYEFVAPF